MASRKEQKEQARAERLAKEQELAAQASKTRRFQIFGGVTVAAIIVIVVAIVVSSGGGTTAVKRNSPEALAAAQHVDTLLAGIPESGVTLGNPKAPVTVTEYGDLECSVCDEFATPTSFTNPEGEAGTGFEDDLISQYVRAGTVKLVYRSLETASSSNPNGNAFALQQAAANAAGLQGKAWYYIELFYNEQGAEGTGYVTESFLDGLAQQIHGLKYAKWLADRKLASVTKQVTTDNANGTSIGNQLSQGVSTPTILIQGPKSDAPAIQGINSSTWTQLQTEIQSVK
jgi:protein-disulfide isomerase